MLDVELIFSLAGLLAMGGWVALLFSPQIPVWSARIAGQVIPGLLAGGYVVLALFFPSNNDGGFGTFAEVTVLFSHEYALLAGWVHFLAFDLFVGAWICSTARSDGIKFWIVLPCLPVTFLFGPAGYLLFSLVRLVAKSAKAGSLFRTPASMANT